MQSNDRVKIKDRLAIQQYRTRYWKQHPLHKLPPHLPSLDATYKVQSVIMEQWVGGGDPVEVAALIQVAPLSGFGTPFRIPTAWLIPEKVENPEMS